MLPNDSHLIFNACSSSLHSLRHRIVYPRVSHIAFQRVSSVVYERVSRSVCQRVSRIMHPRVSPIAGAIASVIVVASCSPSLPTVGGKSATSESPEDRWDPAVSTESLEHDSAAYGVDATFSGTSNARSETLGVAEAVDLAMRNDPATRAAWLRAKGAAASLGASKSANYPEIGVGLSAAYNRQDMYGGGKSTKAGTIGPYASLSWLLLDFGAREAEQNAALAALVAANASQDAVLQDRMLAVVDSYYGCVTAKALIEAADADMQSAQMSYDAATARHAAGKADLGESLQAQTALSRARMAHTAAEGRANVTRANLSALLGLAPGSTLELQTLDEEVDTESVTEDAGKLLERALRSRPDLLATRASAAAAWQRANAAKHRGGPTLSLGANAGFNLYVPQENATSASNLGASLTLHFPIFSGYSTSYEHQRATWEALAAEADVQAMQRRIAQDVWTAFLGLRTAAAQVQEAKGMLETSEKWEQLARGRYSAGIGTIVDLMSAQSTLASARSDYVQARADWLVATVQLSHAAGELNRRSTGVAERGGPLGSAPQQSAPQQSAPQQSAPQQGAPQQSAPQQSAPQGSAPQQSAAEQRNDVLEGR